ncbi:MAG: quinol:cytochrome C oxidoreductase [Planctomycetaceae bacterium]|nr:quinol:cytochrome C oxidoreductase [Planctomycetaceae bacterium]
MASTHVWNPEDNAGATVPVSSRRLSQLGAAVAFVLATAIGIALMSPDGTRRLSHAWLLSGWYAVSISLGALFFIAIQHLVRAGWSVSVRRLAEFLGASIGWPLLLLAPLVLLLLAGHSDLFPWNDPETVQGDKILEGKSAWLNAPFFLVRAVLYAGIWVTCGRWYLRASRRQDETGDASTTLMLESRSAVALLLLGITITFAAFDWLMSLDPHWFSTIFGIYAFSGAMVAGLSVLAIVVAVIVRRQLHPAINCEHLHDVVKLLFGMNCFWAYIAFSQYLLIWYANIPEETVWLRHRQMHGWDSISQALVIGHFVVPFLVLMPRAAKRSTRLVIVMSGLLLVMHWLDLYWVVYPQFAESPVFGLTELLTAAGFAGVLAVGVLLQLRRSAFIPIQDPRLPESVAHHVH